MKVILDRLLFLNENVKNVAVPIFRGLCAYRKQVYDLWREGGLKGVRIGGQFLTILQPRPGFGVLPATNPSIMPEAKLFFDKPHTIEWKGNL